MIEAGTTGRPGILIVEETQETLHSLADLLRNDFHIRATTNPRKALDALATCGDLAIIISCQRMPEMSGIEFLTRAAAIVPCAQRILMTPWADINDCPDSAGQEMLTHYVALPRHGDVLLERLRLISERHLLFQENQRQVNQCIRACVAPGGTSQPKSGTGAVRHRAGRTHELLRSADQQLERSQSLLVSIRRHSGLQSCCGIPS